MKQHHRQKSEEGRESERGDKGPEPQRQGPLEEKKSAGRAQDEILVDECKLGCRLQAEMGVACGVPKREPARLEHL